MDSFHHDFPAETTMISQPKALCRCDSPWKLHLIYENPAFRYTGSVSSLTVFLKITSV